MNKTQLLLVKARNHLKIISINFVTKIIKSCI